MSYHDLTDHNFTSFWCFYFLSVSQVDRSGNRTRVVPVREAKDESWKDAIYQLCVDCLEKGQLPNPEVNYFSLVNKCIDFAFYCSLLYSNSLFVVSC